MSSTNLTLDEYPQNNEHYHSAGLFGQIGAVLLQPGTFFRSLPAISTSRQWVWVAILIVLLAGFAAVRREALLTESTEADTPRTDVMAPVEPGLGEPMMPGGPPPNNSAEEEEPEATPEEVSASWTHGLRASSSLVLQWLAIMVLLCEVSFLSGKRPRLGRNLQIAVWAAVPLGLMALLQLTYYTAGGQIGEDGLSGLLMEWDQFLQMSTFEQNITLALATNLTLFWLWSLLLVYLGARHGLHGNRLASLLVVFATIVVMAIAPIISGDIDAETFIADHSEAVEEEDNLTPDGMLPPGPGMEFGPSNGEMAPSPGPGQMPAGAPQPVTDEMMPDDEVQETPPTGDMESQSGEMPPAPGAQ